VYSSDLVRQLCGDILNQKDYHKAEELISLLQAVIKDDQEEVRVRMAFLAKNYAAVIGESKAADVNPYRSSVTGGK
jgi:hypothetical protein